MAFIKRPKKPTIDLSGPDGNAFVILAAGKGLAKQLGKDWEVISKEMKSGDYENLIQVFDREFEEFVNLIR